MAQSSIAEQAEIMERRELEEMKNKVQGDSGLEEVLRFILEKLTMMQIGLKELRTEQSNVTQKIMKIEAAEAKSKKSLHFCVSELQEIATNNFKVIQATIKQDQDIETLKKQMQTCEIKLQKGTLSITGIKKEEGEDITQKVLEFLKNKMKITQEIKIRTAYRLSKYKVAFQVLDPNKLGLIFGHVKNLKGIKNEDDRFYKLEEILPDHQTREKNKG